MIALHVRLLDGNRQRIPKLSEAMIMPDEISKLYQQFVDTGEKGAEGCWQIS